MCRWDIREAVIGGSAQGGSVLARTEKYFGIVLCNEVSFLETSCVTTSHLLRLAFDNVNRRCAFNCATATLGHRLWTQLY